LIPDAPCRFTIRPLPEKGGGYLIEFPDLPGCMSDGATIEEAITNGIDAMRGWIKAMRAEGHPIRAPIRSEAASAAGRSSVTADAARLECRGRRRHR
jgi:antitoxin HicB